MGNDANRPLAGLKVVESSLLGPGLVATFLADLGADVVKVEPPAGDYVRQMTWPIIEGSSLLHLHTHRGKRSICLDLKQEAGLEVYRELVRGADVVVEAMRPGSLAKLGLGFDDLIQINPNIVFCTISGYGATGPYRDMPSHGIA
ncbi:MAG TPA: CoA transferase, partial [Acidimicrobiaceae bacterium]|nr:CoA transferase [Acidimicrobiaceae bacterium]